MAAYKPPTKTDVYNYDKGNLFTQFGMDPKGNNESGKWARGNQQITGYGLTDANDYAVNTLEPARQANLSNLLAMLQQGNVQAQTQRNSQAMLQQGQGIGNQQAAAAQASGLSPEFIIALKNAAIGNAQRNANQYIGGENQRLMQNQMNAQGLIQQGQQNPFAQLFLQLAQLIEGRSAQNAADKAAGSGLGQLGQLVGMLGGGGFGNLFGQQKQQAPSWMSKIGGFM